MRYITGFLLGAVLTALLMSIFAPGKTIDRIYIKPDTLVQVRTQDRIISYRPADVPGYIDELNDYRTAPGWIDIRGDRIHAGLVEREWFIEYGITRKKNSVSIYAGSVYGIGYSRQIGRFGLGLAVFNSGLSAQASLYF